MKLGVLFGGVSSEHEVSVASACSIINHLNIEKYKIYPIYISKKGNWYHVLEDMPKNSFGWLPKKIKKIKNVFQFLKKLDCVIPVFHGKYGEDGTIQGMLEMLNISYVGCNILTSSICIDKVFTKYVLKNAGISVTPDLYIKYDNNKFCLVNDNFDYQEISVLEIDKLIKNELNYPVFVKPARLGSSVGVIKVSNLNELIDALYNAKDLDDKILIEKAIVGKELECAILGSSASVVGQINSADEFYSYDAKYNNSNSKTLIPASIDDVIMEKIQSIALKAAKVVDIKTIARIDFFLEDNTNKIYLNEINTFPGFTDISMYPKLIEYGGINFSELLDRLINLANCKKSF